MLRYLSIIVFKCLNTILYLVRMRGNHDLSTLLFDFTLIRWLVALMKRVFAKDHSWVIPLTRLLLKRRRHWFVFAFSWACVLHSGLDDPLHPRWLNRGYQGAFLCWCTTTGLPLVDYLWRQRVFDGVVIVSGMLSAALHSSGENRRFLRNMFSF